MTIYLHCGGHKTASSFMKMFLRKNKELFQAQGIAVHLDEFRDREIVAQDIIELAEEDYRNNYQQIIISEDANIIGLMPGIFVASDRNFFHPDSILKFANLVTEISQVYPIRFLLCIRRQDSYLESCYKFRKTHGAKYSLGEFLIKAAEINISWYEIVEAVANRIGKENCIITPYELLKQSQTKFIDLFFRSINNLDLAKAIIPPPSNKGASELMMAVIDYFSDCFDDIPPKHRQELIAIIKKHETKNSNRASLFSDINRSEILQKYADDNQKLFSNYIPYLSSNYYSLELGKNNTVSSDRLTVINK